eukprot:6175170-Pleurochrysis_carterae.AAC.2
MQQDFISAVSRVQATAPLTCSSHSLPQDLSARASWRWVRFKPRTAACKRTNVSQRLRANAFSAGGTSLSRPKKRQLTHLQRAACDAIRCVRSPGTQQRLCAHREARNQVTKSLTNTLNFSIRGQPRSARREEGRRRRDGVEKTRNREGPCLREASEKREGSKGGWAAERERGRSEVGPK